MYFIICEFLNGDAADGYYNMTICIYVYNLTMSYGLVLPDNKLYIL